MENDINLELINSKATELFLNYYGKPEDLSRIILEELNKLNKQLYSAGINTQRLFEELNNYTPKSKILFNKQIELVTSFFGSLDAEYVKYIKQVLYNPNTQVIFGNHPSVNVYGNRVELTNYGDLRDVYSMVHEFAHVLDLKNGENETRAILSETNVQTMERIFDSFLKKLSFQQLEYFELNKDLVNQDINARNLTTFFDRYRSTMEVMKNPNDAVARRYMVAQLYSSRINSLSYDEQVNIINFLINSARKNDFADAISMIPLNLSKDNQDIGKDISLSMEKLVELIVEKNNANLKVESLELNSKMSLNNAKVKKLVNTPQNNQINSNGTINILFIVIIIVLTVIITILLLQYYYLN